MLTVLGALVLASCATPAASSDGPGAAPTSAATAPSSTELFDIADRDPLPFPGYDVTRVTIAPLPGAATI